MATRLKTSTSSTALGQRTLGAKLKTATSSTALGQRALGAKLKTVASSTDIDQKVFGNPIKRKALGSIQNLPNANGEQSKGIGIAKRKIYKTRGWLQKASVAARRTVDQPVKKSFLRPSEKSSNPPSDKTWASKSNALKTALKHVDPVSFTEYPADVHEHLKQMESSRPLRQDFLTKQSEITSDHRAKLVNWLILLASELDLECETLHLTVVMIDLYLQTVGLPLSSFQLLGVTALFVSAKYEEITPPTVEDLVYFTDYSSTKKEILAMETKLLYALKFNVGQPLSVQFLNFYNAALAAENLVGTAASYFLELSLLDCGMSSVPASLKAASASFLARWACKKAEIEESLEVESSLQQLAEYSGHTVNEVTSVAKKLAVLLLRSEAWDNVTPRKKFCASGRYRECLLLQICVAVESFVSG